MAASSYCTEHGHSDPPPTSGWPALIALSSARKSGRSNTTHNAFNHRIAGLFQVSSSSTGYKRGKQTKCRPPRVDICKNRNNEQSIVGPSVQQKYERALATGGFNNGRAQMNEIGSLFHGEPSIRFSTKPNWRPFCYGAAASVCDTGVCSVAAIR